MTYEELLLAAEKMGIDVIEYKFSSERIKGLYCDGTIALNDQIATDTEKACILSEELGHYHTSSGDILDLYNSLNAKQEYHARLWGYNNQVGLSGIVSCFRANCHNLFEMAEHLNVTEEYLMSVLQCYRNKYGNYTHYKNYIIYFEPTISVLELM